MFDLNDILKGYSSEQYTEAMIYMIANFLKDRELIDIQEFQEYHAKNLSEILEKIIERDRKINKEKLEKLKVGE